MNAISDSRSIAVVRARLPYIDRRSLSQAWFSALHLAENSFAGRAPGQRTMLTPGAGARTLATRHSAGVAPVGSVRVDAALRRDWASGGAGRAGRGAEAPAGVRRAARAASASAHEATRSYPPFRTTLTLGLEGARVALLLRRDGAVLHVFALCAPAHVDLVRRALACADAHLRLRGDRVRSTVTATVAARA